MPNLKFQFLTESYNAQPLLLSMEAKGLKLIIVQSDLISLWVGWCVDTNMSVSSVVARNHPKIWPQNLWPGLLCDRYQDHNGFREKMFLQLRP